jgi:hypothetical protein
MYTVFGGLVPGQVPAGHLIEHVQRQPPFSRCPTSSGIPALTRRAPTSGVAFTAAGAHSGRHRTRRRRGATRPAPTATSAASVDTFGAFTKTPFPQTRAGLLQRPPSLWITTYTPFKDRIHRHHLLPAIALQRRPRIGCHRVRSDGDRRQELWRASFRSTAAVSRLGVRREA